MEFMLSLSHNPFDPFEQYDLWKQFDRSEGFDTDGFLARCVSTSDEFPDELQNQYIEAAIDSIVANPSFEGLYKKVSKPS